LEKFKIITGAIGQLKLLIPKDFKYDGHSVPKILFTVEQAFGDFNK